MMDLLNLNCREFVETTASKAPVPGGGGVSALTGALAAALGDMVGELTVGKKKYEAYEQEMLGKMSEIKALMKEFLVKVNEDAEAFEPLSKAYSMPKDTPGYDEIKEKCLKEAAAVPMDILELSEKTIGLIAYFAEKGSIIAVSDAAAAAALCRAAAFGASVNVKANTRLMKDREYAEAMEEKAEKLRENCALEADKIFEGVMTRL